ncbi:hypothetical protein QQ045_027560 [Rhodiola kirilowii]
MEKHHSAKEKKSSMLSWIVVPPGSSNNPIVSESSLTAKESMVNPKVLPISGEYEISHEDLFNLVIHDDEDSDYCIVNKCTIGKGDGTDGVEKNSDNKINGAEGSYNGSVKTASDGPNTNKSPLDAPKFGFPYMMAGNIFGSSNVYMAHSTAGAAAEPKHFGFRPFNFSHSGEHAADDDSNFDYLSVKDDLVELKFEVDLRHTKSFAMQHIKADGNCLFRAVASQVYGNSKMYDVVRETCVSYMIRNHGHFSRFVNGDFMSYCTLKRNDKVYGETLELVALAYAYNRPIHTYSYNIERVNVIHPPYAGNATPIKLSCHYGNHYNSLVEVPRDFPIWGCAGLQAANPSGVTGGSVMNLSEAAHFANDQWLRRSAPDSSNEDIFDAMLAWECGAELNIGGFISVGPGFNMNSIELALCLGFDYPEIAAAYHIFGNDGSSMLYHLFATDSYAY